MAKIKVKKIIDGDTFQDTKGRFYRLADINAPEKKKSGYQKAKAILKDLIGDEELIIKQVGKSYTRKVVIARKPREKTTINQKMRRKGYK